MNLSKLLPISLLILSMSSYAETSRTHTTSTSTYANQHELTKISSFHRAVIVNNTDRRHTYHIKFELCGNKCTKHREKIRLEAGKSKRIEEWLVLITKYDIAGRYETFSSSSIREIPEATTSDKGYIDIYGHY